MLLPWNAGNSTTAATVQLWAAEGTHISTLTRRGNKISLVMPPQEDYQSEGPVCPLTFKVAS